MNIKNAKQLTGISEQMIRFYEKKKIIQPKRDLENGYRLYTNHEIFLMVLARSYNSLGIPLNNVLDYIHPIDFMQLSKNLESSIEDLKKQEKWIKQKIIYAQDLSSIFIDLSNHVEFSILQFDILYFYPNSTNQDQKYSDMFKYVEVSRAVLRVDRNILDGDIYPNDIGVLITTNIEDSEVNPIIYRNVSLIRFYKETPVSEVIPPSGIHELFNKVQELGYTTIDDCFIYQIAEKTGNNPLDVICVEFLIRKD